MTGNEFLLFVGGPAFFAIILLIVDYRHARRRRLESLIARTLPDEYPAQALEQAPQTTPTNSAGQADPLAELERLIGTKRPS